MNFSEDQTVKTLQNSQYDVIAVDNNKVIGMGRLIGDGLYYVIADVVVQPKYQMQGIGTSLMYMIIDYVDSNTPLGGRASIQLTCEKGKEHFYEKMGFLKIPNEFCGSGMRKIIHKDI